MNTKAELLALLIEDFKKSVRLPGDISIRDVQTAIERDTGMKIGVKKATGMLNAREDLEALKVTGDTGYMWVWRKRQPKRKTHDRQQTRRTQQRAAPQ